MEQDILVPAGSDLAATLLSKHTLPLGIKVKLTDLPWSGVERATFTLLWTGRRHVFLTCFHVLSRLREIQKQNPLAQIVAYLTSAPRLVELNGFTLLDHQQTLDVAIFGGREDIVELPGLQFVDYKSSYLADPMPGDPVSIAGYPGANVTVTHDKADFGFMHIGFMASCVSDRRIILANESGGRRFVDYDVPTRSRIALGGLSGSPAFVIRNQRARFVGIVTDASEKDQTIIISRLGCINPDGTLDHNTIPS